MRTCFLSTSHNVVAPPSLPNYTVLRIMCHVKRSSPTAVLWLFLHKTIVHLKMWCNPLIPSHGSHPPSQLCQWQEALPGKRLSINLSQFTSTNSCWHLKPRNDGQPDWASSWSVGRAGRLLLYWQSPFSVSLWYHYIRKLVSFCISLHLPTLRNGTKLW